jgi:anthranilate phosphoribosyltransferase
VKLDQLEEAVRFVRSGHDLSEEEMGGVIDFLLTGQADSNKVRDLLLALRDKGETANELVGAARAMRRHMTPITHHHPVLLDTCGTGGSGSGSFNISTAVAIVIAACGVPVAKHGNRRATSPSGSADVLSALGVAIEGEAERVSEILNQIGICFCFAPKLHPAMRHVIEVRKQLRVPTMFNVLGPLCNPAGATHQLLGTASLADRDKLACALSRLGTTRSAVVWGDDGQDEVTLGGFTEVADVRPTSIDLFRWSAKDFGLTSVTLSQLRVSSPEQSAEIIRGIFNGVRGPARDVVLAGSAAGLWLVGHSSTIRDGVQAAAVAIDEGKVLAKLHELIQFSAA